jgi:hypothetical protein
MSERLFENVVTLRIVSDAPIPTDTHIANLSFIVCTHTAALIGQTIKSRRMTAAETAAIDPNARAMIGEDPDRTRVDDPASLVVAQLAQSKAGLDAMKRAAAAAGFDLRGKERAK